MDQKPASSNTREYDVFISYRHIADDGGWVCETLVPALEAAGLQVCLDEVSFRPGTPVILEMERAVLQSHFTVGVFTPEYAYSGFTELEQVMAKHLGAKEQEARFIGLLYRDCALPLMSRSTLMLDMRDKSKFEANIQRLVDAVKRPVVSC